VLDPLHQLPPLTGKFVRPGERENVDLRGTRLTERDRRSDGARPACDYIVDQKNSLSGDLLPISSEFSKEIFQPIFSCKRSLRREVPVCSQGEKGTADTKVEAQLPRDQRHLSVASPSKGAICGWDRHDEIPTPTMLGGKCTGANRKHTLSCEITGERPLTGVLESLDELLD